MERAPKPKRPKTGGRKKGTPNKTTALLKDAVLQAAEKAGGAGGLVAYLSAQAKQNPAAFMTLLGKVLPTQLTGPGGGAVQLQHVSDEEPARGRVEQRVAALAERMRTARGERVH